MLQECTVCPHKCGVNRIEGELGLCQVASLARIADYSAHFGEEDPLVGSHGSGTIFFSGCNLHCVFCQNHAISHLDAAGDRAGDAVTSRQLAGIMLKLQSQGCHNINLVSPSHVVPQILSALPDAIQMGLHLPLVYNSGGYDSLESLKLLDGVIDIYMPDCKFQSAEVANRYTAARDYPEVMFRAVSEMFRQVGDLQLNDSGLAQRGLLIRHLIMPGMLEETKGILEFIATKISKNTYVNLMDQYRPCHRANEFESLKNTLTAQEYQKALKLAKEAGLRRLDQRDFSSLLQNLLKTF